MRRTTRRLCIAAACLAVFLMAVGSTDAKTRLGHLHFRERAAISRYAHSTGGTSGRCMVFGYHHRDVLCTVTVDVYLHPSGLLLGYDHAVIHAFPDFGYIGMLRRGDWWMAPLVPGTVSGPS